MNFRHHVTHHWVTFVYSYPDPRKAPMSNLTADQFNAEHPIGTPVLFWPGSKNHQARRSTTRTPAWDMNPGMPVVSIEGYAGGIALSHVEPTGEPQGTSVSAEQVEAAAAKLWEDFRDFRTFPWEGLTEHQQNQIRRHIAAAFRAAGFQVEGDPR